MNTFTTIYLKDKLQRFVGVAKSCMVEITIIPDEIDHFDYAKNIVRLKDVELPED
ncbi:MAG: hypothetical protein IPM96_21760 [Ignavibacteria bacterium]|nr:hypothetical protein [Ignavibacteria bacterium]